MKILSRDEHYGLMRLMGKQQQQPIDIRFTGYVGGPRYIIGAGISEYHGDMSYPGDGIHIRIEIAKKRIFLAVWDRDKNYAWQYLDLYNFADSDSHE